MGAQTRELYRRIRSVESTKKITKAQELIAASRIIKSQQRADAARPYTRALVSALEAAASRAQLNHPLLSATTTPQRAAVLVLTADRGFAGAYTPNVVRQAEALRGLLEEQNIEMRPYVVGTKGVNWFRFRGREIDGIYEGFTGQPMPSDARRVAEDLLSAINTPAEDGGVDEIHIVSTHFRSMVSQEVRTRRLFPVVVEDVEEPLRQASGVSTGPESAGTGEHPEPRSAGRNGDEPLPLYEFEPSPEVVMDTLLPQFATNLVYTSMLDAAASEWAARRRAMKSATDNAGELQESLTREANAARQAEITQEISEIVGGADAQAGATAE